MRSPLSSSSWAAGRPRDDEGEREETVEEEGAAVGVEGSLPGCGAGRVLLERMVMGLLSPLTGGGGVGGAPTGASHPCPGGEGFGM